jgi:membrane protease YdiL (CAAX protease family)
VNFVRFVKVRERLLARWWFRILVTLGGTTVVGVAVLPFVHDPLLAQCTLYGTLAALMIGMEAGRKGSVWYTCGLYVGETTRREMWWGASVALGSLGAIALIALAIGGTFVPAPASARPLVGIIAMIIVAAVGEEILFRGTIFLAIEERFGGTAAVLLTSLLFAVAHAGNPDVSMLALVNVFLAGVLMGTMLMRSSSLWPSIIFHIVWNLLVALCFGDVSGNDLGGGAVVLDLSHAAPSLQWLVSGSFGVEEGLLTTFLLVGATIVVARRIPSSAYVVAARFRRSHLEALTSTAS